MDRERIEFRGSAREDLRAFPQAARREAGFQLDRVQCGLEPENWKPMSTTGAGVREIRITDAAGAFRVMYVVKFSSALYVLHGFQKKTQRTRESDTEWAAPAISRTVKRITIMNRKRDDSVWDAIEETAE